MARRCTIACTFLFCLTWSPAADAKTAAVISYPPQVELDLVNQLAKRAGSVHPRLFADDARFSSIKEKCASDPFCQSVGTSVVRRAKLLLETEPVKRELEGRRLLDVSRTCLQRVLTLAMAYRLTGRQEFATRAEVEMRAAAEFQDWNPSHFLDVGEMTLALAIGYDWLYHELPRSSRELIRQAIVEKSLKLPWETKHKGWVRSTNNWGQVCHAGLTCGALAVMEDHPELAAKTIKNATDHVVRSMHVYDPAGCYPEGPSYWAYGTGFNVVLIDALESTLGTDFGLSLAPGFDRTGSYPALVTGPSGQTFNYSDGGSSRSPQSCLFWFAKRYDRNDWLLGEQQRVEDFYRSVSSKNAGNSKGRLLPLLLVWYGDASGSPSDRLPLHWNSGGEVPITIHRSGWEHTDTFVGLKAGSPAANHGNMDIGSFVLDAGGVRWAFDLGAEGYHGIESRGLNLWDRDQASDRWQIFRQSNHGHNTLVIDEQLQRAKGVGRIIEFSGNQAGGHTVIDLSDVYSDQAESVRRMTRVHADGSLLIEDHLVGLNPGARVRFGMLTRGKPTSDSKAPSDTLRLTQGDAQLLLHVKGPSDAHWQIIDTAKPRQPWDSPNPGTRMVAFECVTPATGDLHWTVRLTPSAR